MEDDQKPKKFAVYFEQVNQTRWEVTARSEDEAVRKARLLWRQAYAVPVLGGIEEEKSGKS